MAYNLKGSQSEAGRNGQHKSCKYCIGTVFRCYGDACGGSVVCAYSSLLQNSSAIQNFVEMEAQMDAPPRKWGLKHAMGLDFSEELKESKNMVGDMKNTMNELKETLKAGVNVKVGGSEAFEKLAGIVEDLSANGVDVNVKDSTGIATILTKILNAITSAGGFVKETAIHILKGMSNIGGGFLKSFFDIFSFKDLLEPEHDETKRILGLLTIFALGYIQYKNVTNLNLRMITTALMWVIVWLTGMDTVMVAALVGWTGGTIIAFVKDWYDYWNIPTPSDAAKAALVNGRSTAYNYHNMLCVYAAKYGGIFNEETLADEDKILFLQGREEQKCEAEFFKQTSEQWKEGLEHEEEEVESVEESKSLYQKAVSAIKNFPAYLLSGNAWEDSKAFVNFIYESICSFIASFMDNPRDYINLANVKNFLKSCKLLQELRNGASFTISSICELVIEVLNALGSPLGLTLFKKTYTKFPELYDIGDEMTALSDIIHKGGAVTAKQAGHFSAQKAKLEAVKKRIPMNKEYAMYHRQAELITQLASKIEHTLLTHGVYSGNFRPKPFVATFLGQSQIGKTQIIDLIERFLAPYVVGEDRLADYEKNRADFTYCWKNREFQDTFRAGTKIIRLDDWAQIKAATNPDNCPGQLMIDLVNNEPCPINMAEAHRKNTVSAEHSLQLISTNLIQWNDDRFYVMEPQAVKNRLGTKLMVHLKEEYREYVDPEKTKYRLALCSCFRDECDKIHARRFDPSVYYFEEWSYSDTTTYDSQSVPKKSYDFDQVCKLLAKQYLDHMDTEAQKITAYNVAAKDKRLNPLLNDEGKPLSEYEIRDLPDPSAEPVRSGASTPIHVVANGDEARKVQQKLDEIHANMIIPAEAKEDLIKYYTTQLATLQMLNLEKGLDKSRQEEFRVRRRQWFSQLLNGTLPPEHRASYPGRPSEVVGYLFPWQQKHWASVMYEDEEWCKFMLQHYEELCDWGATSTVGGILKESVRLFKLNMDPREIVPQMRTIILYFYSIYQKMKDFYFRLNMTYNVVWQSFKNLDFVDAMKASFETLKCWVAIETRKLISEFVATYTLFSFTGLWVKSALVAIPTLIVAYNMMDKGFVEMQAQGDYVKKQAVKKVRPKKVKIKKIDLAKGDVSEVAVEVNAHADKARPIDRLACLTESIDKHNKYSMMLVDSDMKPYFNMAMCIFLREHIGITNAHVIKCVSILKAREYPYMVKFTNVGTLQEHIVSVNDIDCLYDHSKDIAVFQCAATSAMPPRRDITRLFVPASERLPTPGKAYMNYSKMICETIEDACVPVKMVKHIAEVETFQDSHSYCYEGNVKKTGLDMTELEEEIFGSDRYHFGPSSLIHYRMKGVVGMCTSELWANIKGNMYIIGIHNGAKEDHSMCIKLTREYIISMIVKFKRMISVSVPFVPVEIMACSEIPRQFMPIKEAPAISKPTRSGITRTRLFGIFGVSKIPAQLSPFEYNGQVYDPEGMARAKYSPNRGPINSTIYDLAGDAYIQKVIRNIPGISHDRVLSLDEVVHGVDSLEGIPRNTSVGAVYGAMGMTKASIFGTDDRRNLDSPHGQKFAGDFEDVMNILKSGNGYNFITSEFGKAECLPEEDVLRGKLRLISNPEMLDAAVAKALFGFAMNLFLNNPIATDTLIGVNPYSRQWHEYYMKFRGYKVIAGDVKGFDRQFGSWKWMMCLKVCEALYPHSTEEERRARRAYVESSINSIHRAVFEDCSIDYMWESNMSSGKYITILFNSIANNIDLRYVSFCAWVEEVLGIDHMEYYPTVDMPIIPVQDILSNMVFTTLGDDHTVGVRGHVMSWLNHSKVSDIYARSGCEYTDEAKNVGADIPLRDMNEVEMCKRTWRWDSDLMRYVGPLNLKSIHESLNWSENKDTLTEMVIDTALGEYALHGIDVWNQYAPSLIKASIRLYNHYPKWTKYKQALRGITSEAAQWDLEDYEPCELRLICVETNPGPISICIVTDETGFPRYKAATDDSELQKLVGKMLAPLEQLPVVPEDYVPARDHAMWLAGFKSIIKLIKLQFKFLSYGSERFITLFKIDWNRFRTFFSKHCDLVFNHYDVFPETADYTVTGAFITETESRSKVYEFDITKTNVLSLLVRELKPMMIAYDLLRGCKMVLRYYKADEVKVVQPDPDGDIRDEFMEADEMDPLELAIIEQLKPVRLEPQSDDVRPIKETIETTEFVDDAEHVVSNFQTESQGGNKSSDMVSIASFLHRPQLMGTMTWSNTQLENTVLYSIDVTSALLSNSWWKNKIQGFGMWRATACLKVVLNANPFMAGKLITTFLPANAVDHAKTYNCHLCLKTQQPNVILDASQSSSVLEVPFVSPYHYFDTNNTSIGAFGTFYLSVLSYLAVDPAGATSADVAVYLYFKDVEVCQPIMPQSDKPRRISRRTMGVDDSEKERLAMEGDRSISSALMATSNAAASLSSIPIISSYMGPVSWALRAASTSAASFGWAKPSTNTTTTVVAKQSNRFMGVSDGEDVSLPLGLASDNSVRILDNVSIRDEDEMSFSFLKQVYAYLRAIPWLVGAKPTTFQSIPINPKSLYTGGSTIVGTKTAMWSVGPPVWYLCSGFQYWRGSIKLKFIIVKTKFHTGRLEFVFTPGTTLASGVTVYSSTYSLREIVDIRNSDEVELTLPYLLPMDYLDIAQLSGTLTINVLTSLRAPANVAQSVNILMFAAGGPDFELAAPIGGMALPIPFTPQGDNVRNIDGVLTSTVIGGRETNQRAGTSPADVCMGEIFTSIRQLLSRATMMRANSVAYKNTFPTLSVYPWHFGSTSLDASGMVVPNWGGDTLSFMAPMYNFFRGSMRVHMWNDGGATVPERVQTASLAPMAYWPTTAQPVDVGTWFLGYNNLGGGWFTTSASNGSANTFGFTSVTFNDFGTGSMHVRVPYYNVTRVSNVKLAVTNSVVTDATTPDVRVVYVGHGNYSSAQVARSIGDDFQFSYFISTVPLLDSWN